VAKGHRIAPHRSSGRRGREELPFGQLALLLIARLRNRPGPPLTAKTAATAFASREGAAADRPFRCHSKARPMLQHRPCSMHQSVRLRRVSAEDHVTGIVTECNAVVTSQFPPPS